MLALDLGVFHRKNDAVHTREALIWSAVWIGLSLLLNAGIFWRLGHEAGMAFLAGYLLEKALSVDNLFVFLLIFQFFRVPEKFQPRILTWGILSAIVFRAAFIFAGVALVERFEAVLYLFGAFLLYTAVKMVTAGDRPPHPDRNPVVRFLRKRLPFRDDLADGHFFVDGKASLMFLVLVSVEVTDLIFAVDSIPAVLAITTDPFLVFSSNIMAILGLRSLYFALAGLMTRFRFLKYGLAAVLFFVGLKMLLAEVVAIPVAVSLGVVVGVLAVAVGASWVLPETASPTPASQ